MKHYLNVCDINGAAVPPVDIITFGSPCFVAGTLILTDKGYDMAKFGAKTLASLFDGSGGFPLAATLEGIEPIWCSEIEPYPIAVTMERFPEVM